jgi:UDP-galactopyranose mutase
MPIFYRHNRNQIKISIKKSVLLGVNKGKKLPKSSLMHIYAFLGCLLFIETKRLMTQYDYLIVGAGLYGASFAYKAHQQGKRCLVIDRRPHLGGNIYCENIEGINVHKYGAHIFHTSNKDVWNFVNSIVEFNRYTNSPIANYKGKLYNLPFNMNTFYELWGSKTPEEARKKIEEQKQLYGVISPKNLEEQAINLVGKDIYEILIKGYTEKQWGRQATEIPAFIIKRIPVRFTFNNNYFNDKYQGIPIGGYNKLIDGLLLGIETKINVDFFKNRSYWENIADKILFTGMIDEFYGYCFGKLEYRTLYFEEEILDCDNYQGNAVVNFTDINTPFTRIIEHKHFEFGTQSKTVISKEYSAEWQTGSEAYYPINDQKNNILYQKYKELANNDIKYIFGGRLAEYKYYDMHQIIEQILNKFY